jgi:putative transposase
MPISPTASPASPSSWRIVLEHDHRRVLHFHVTDDPAGAWTAQQIVGAFARREAAQYLIRDRDGRYSAELRLQIKSPGIREILRPPLDVAGVLLCD